MILRKVERLLPAPKDGEAANSYVMEPAVVMIPTANGCSSDVFRQHLSFRAFTPENVELGLTKIVFESYSKDDKSGVIVTPKDSFWGCSIGATYNSGVDVYVDKGETVVNEVLAHTKVIFSDGKEHVFAIQIAASVRGKTGQGSEIHEWYLLNESDSAPSTKPSRSAAGWAIDNGWVLGTAATKDQLTPTSKNRYLWNIEETVTIDTSGSYSSIFSPAHLDTWWTEDGNGIASIVDTYVASDDGKVAPSTGYDTYKNAIVFWSIGKPYLWNKTVISYSDGSNTTRYHICSFFGLGSLSGFIEEPVVRHYLASSASSGITSNTSGWSTDIQTITSKNRYLWYYETHLFKCISEKGRNLLPQTQGFYSGVSLNGDSKILNNITDSNGRSFRYIYSYAKTDLQYVTEKYSSRGITVNLMDNESSSTFLHPAAGAAYRLGTSIYVFNGSTWEENVQSDVEVDLCIAAGSAYRLGTSIYVFNGSTWEENVQSNVEVVQWIDVMTPESNTYYTLSFTAKGSCELNCYLYSSAVVEMVCSDGQIKTWSANSDGCVVITLSSDNWQNFWIRWKTGSNVSNSVNVLFRIFRGSSAQFVYLYQPKLRKGEDTDEWTPAPQDLTVSTSPVIIGVYGDKGNRGAVIRGPQAWSDVAVGFQFLSGAEGEEFIDIVIYNDNYYACSVSHIKIASNDPATSVANNDGKWKLAQKFDLVATKILLATYALVKNLGVESIDMKDADGNIAFQAKDGNVIANKGTFNNVIINGTIKSKCFYDEFIQPSTSGITWNPLQMGSNIILPANTSKGHIILPSASLNKGVILKLCCIDDDYSGQGGNWLIKAGYNYSGHIMSWDSKMAVFGLRGTNEYLRITSRYAEIISAPFLCSPAEIDKWTWYLLQGTGSIESNDNYLET